MIVFTSMLVINLANQQHLCSQKTSPVHNNFPFATSRRKCNETTTVIRVVSSIIFKNQSLLFSACVWGDVSSYLWLKTHLRAEDNKQLQWLWLKRWSESPTNRNPNFPWRLHHSVSVRHAVLSVLIYSLWMSLFFTVGSKNVWNLGIYSLFSQWLPLTPTDDLMTEASINNRGGRGSSLSSARWTHPEQPSTWNSWPPESVKEEEEEEGEATFMWTNMQPAHKVRLLNTPLKT